MTARREPVIYYRGGYRKVTTRPCSALTAIVGYSAGNDFVRLDATGLLHIASRYAWDGASRWPDFSTILRGSLIHDALYQLMRECGLPRTLRQAADRELLRACQEDGMLAAHAWLVYLSVRLGGRWATRPGDAHPELTAPG